MKSKETLLDSEYRYCRGIEIQGLNLLRQGSIFTSFILVWDLFLEQQNTIHLESCHPINTPYTLNVSLFSNCTLYNKIFFTLSIIRMV